MSAPMCPHCEEYSMSPDMIDAIVNRKTRNAEVADLRAELAEMTEAKNAHITFQNHNAKLVQARDDEIAALKREVERLRGALRKIANQKLQAEMREDEYPVADYAGAYGAIVEAARAALAHKEPGDEG